VLKAMCGLVLLVLTACSTTTSKPVAVQQADLQTLRVGIAPDYPPIIFKKDGQVCGVEADLAAYVAQQLGTRLEFIEMPFDELVPSLEARKIDAIMSGMSIADSRREKVRFISPYLHMGQMALVRTADAARLSASGALEKGGLRVGCISGTTGELFVRQNMSNSVCQAFAGPEEALTQLRDGQLDVYIDDAPFVLQATKDEPTFKTIPWLLTDEYLAWAVPRGTDYDYLYDQLNLISQRAKQRGDLQRIIRQYFEIEVRVK